jgi:hypothetical protein
VNIKKTVRLAGAVTLALGSVSCGDVVRDGQASSYLIITSLQASSGADDEFGGDLRSDVVTVVNDVPTTFNDSGQVQFMLGMKDPGAPGSPSQPSQANFITINRYRVAYSRTDGRNTPGVDVPYAFDGALTGTVSGDATFDFTIVRHQAKDEAPLRALAGNGILVSTIAEVTFYGHDQTGRAVSVSGRISVHFGNFGDPS